ncbi:hypothetical protein [Streptomyces sp. NPDC055400]
MDLLDWYRGRLSSRRLAVLVRHLPRDSALARELHGESADWSATEHLLAHIADQLADANWMFATVNRDEESEPLEFPRPYPRPGSTDEAAEDSPTQPAPASDEPNPAELARFFGS